MNTWWRVKKNKKKQAYQWHNLLHIHTCWGREMPEVQLPRWWYRNLTQLDPRGHTRLTNTFFHYLIEMKAQTERKIIWGGKQFCRYVKCCFQTNLANTTKKNRVFFIWANMWVFLQNINNKQSSAVCKKITLEQVRFIMIICYIIIH